MLLVGGTGALRRPLRLTGVRLRLMAETPQEVDCEPGGNGEEKRVLGHVASGAAVLISTR